MFHCENNNLLQTNIFPKLFKYRIFGGCCILSLNAYGKLL